MHHFNQIVTNIFNWVFYPFSRLDSVWSLIFISILTGILMLLIFKKVSNQKRIALIKDKIKAHILEMRLYNDNILISFQALGSIFKWNLRYLGHAMRPMLILILPVMVILIQLAIRFEYRPLKVGESGLVTIIFDKAIEDPHFKLSGSEGIIIETPPLLIPEEHKIYWRIRGDSTGIGALHFISERDTITKNIVVGSGRKPLAASRVDNHVIKQFLFPGEAALPSDSHLKEVTIHYPHQALLIFGVQISWLVFFFILSILAGFALKGTFGVEI